MRKTLLTCLESRAENNFTLYGRFQLGPFQLGQAVTVANNLRKGMLSELVGIGIVAAEVYDANHEYSTLKGVQESLFDILLNLKQIVVKSAFPLSSPQVGFLQECGPTIVRAGDLKLPPSLQVVDPEHHIATLCRDGCLKLKIFVWQGKNELIQPFSLFRGNLSPLFLEEAYDELSDLSLTREWRKAFSRKRKLFKLDPLFTPVKNVNFVIELDDNFEEKIQIERITLEIWTNGSIKPRDALYGGAKGIIGLLSCFQTIGPIKRKLPGSTYLERHRKSYTSSLHLQSKETSDQGSTFTLVSFLPSSSLESQDHFFLQRSRRKNVNKRLIDLQSKSKRVDWKKDFKEKSLSIFTGSFERANFVENTFQTSQREDESQSKTLSKTKTSLVKRMEHKNRSYLLLLELENLDLSLRLFTLLKQQNIHTLGTLIRSFYEGRIQGLNKNLEKQIRKKLERFCLSQKDLVSL